MKFIVMFLIVVIFTGCISDTKTRYILENQSSSINRVQKSIKSIGIKNIELPGYMLQTGIAVLKKDNQLYYLKDKLWAVNMDEQLTKRLISTFQRALNNPNITKYPWNSHKRPNKIVQVVINKFIANETHIVLDASWSLLDTRSKNLKSRLFFDKIDIDTKDEIVSKMSELFYRLEMEIIQSL